MIGKKCIITGVPGVGKTTVVTESLKKLSELGVNYTYLNFGTVMFEIAQKENGIVDRDEMRRLDRRVQKEIQKRAGQRIGQISTNVLIDTHVSVKTPYGYLPGLPEWVLREINPDIIVLVEADEDQILRRRLKDETRCRDYEGSHSIKDHQEFNRSLAAAYSFVTGCTVQSIFNSDLLLERARDDLVSILR